MLDLSYIVLSLHFLLLTILCLFGIHRMSMAWRWWYYRKTELAKPEIFDSLPKVTIQIPLYNERLVAERVVQAIAQIDYPQDKLQIQIVDDSTDETAELVAQSVAQYAKQGIDIQHVHRTNRQGYKAGALKEAMESASGEFIAIFDADFIPYPSIIKDTIDQFTNEKVAMVQFRWEHLNRFDSKLTEAQGMMLDAHFALEQNVRHASKVLFNFNGTAGIWRKKAIIDAGNWSADTLTEDLDLSYRAQLKGWQLVYLNDVGCPGEIPADMNAFKSQQHRWAKGGIQVMKKLLLKVWRSPLSLRHKLESTFHLSNNLAYFVMLVDTIFLLVPSLIVREQYQISYILWLDLPLLLFSSGGHLIYFFFGQVALGRSKWRAIKNMPRILLMGIQLAFSNSKAAIEALMGQESEFVRTPKSGDREDESILLNDEVRLNKNTSLDTGKETRDTSLVKTKESTLSKNFYKAVSPQGEFFEALLAVIYSIVFLWCLSRGFWLMLPFLAFLIVGFFSNAASTLKYKLKYKLR